MRDASPPHRAATTALLQPLPPSSWRLGLKFRTAMPGARPKVKRTLSPFDVARPPAPRKKLAPFVSSLNLRSFDEVGVGQLWAYSWSRCSNMKIPTPSAPYQSHA